MRAQGLSDVSAVKGRVSVPVVGIWKEGDEGIYITPTLRHARCVSAAGADVVALDGTRRERADGLSLAETIERLKREYDVVVMADCGSVDDGLFAAEAGADLIGTTLCGYTGSAPKPTGPTMRLLKPLSRSSMVTVPSSLRDVSTPRIKRAVRWTWEPTPLW